MIEVEKEYVEIPKRSRTSKASKYPWESLLIEGHSFFAPGVKVTTMRVGAARVAKLAGDGRRYIVRKAEKDGVEGVRVWRVA